MANDYMRFSEATEATDAQMTDAGLVAVSVVDQSSASGYSTKRSPLSRLGNYILNKYAALQLGGVARTVKAAIDAIATSVTNLTTLIGSSAMGTDATTVTGAIAEHESDISSINASLSVKLKSYSAGQYSIAANSAHGFSASDFSVATPDGYTPVALVYYSTGLANCLVYSVNARATGSERMMSIMNVGSSESTVQPAITVMYVKSSIYST